MKLSTVLLCQLITTRWNCRNCLPVRDSVITNLRRSHWIDNTCGLTWTSKGDIFSRKSRFFTHRPAFSAPRKGSPVWISFLNISYAKTRIVWLLEYATRWMIRCSHFDTINDVKEYHDLEISVKRHSKSLEKMAPFGRSHTSSHWRSAGRFFKKFLYLSTSAKNY